MIRHLRCGAVQGEGAVRFCVLAVLLATAPICAAGVHEGVEALAKRDFAEARRQFEAAQSDPEGLYQLGRMALAGLGEPADPGRAYALFERASQAGHQEASLMLARALLSGVGIPRDEARGMALLAKLAQDGMPRAQLVYGWALEFGKYGAARDEAAAVEWYRRAMDGGDAEALVSYATMLGLGRGVAQDEARALAILKAAAERNSAVAIVAYGRMLAAGRGAPKDEAEALRQYRRAAETGLAEAQYEVGAAYLFGRGVARDAREAARWIDAAARQGNAGAQYVYAEMFRTGAGVPANPIEAYKWYLITAAPPRSGGLAQRADDRRARLAADMSSAQIAEAGRRAARFHAERGVRPVSGKPQELAHGDTVEVGGHRVNVPLPRGYVNGWELMEKVRASMPNLDSHNTALVGISQEDLDRIRLGVRVPDLRLLELLRFGNDHTVNVTPQLFGELRGQFRDAVAATATQKQTQILRDDEQALVLLQVTAAGARDEGSVAAIGLLRLNQRALVIRLFSRAPSEDAKARIAAVAREWADLLLNAN
jgi:uncharacterized protein